MKIKINCKVPGIYVIKNLVNGKVYVGKSKNCYKRLHQHLYDIKTESRNFNENIHLLNAFKLYGTDNFTYYIVESFHEDLENLEEILSERELFWMKELKSLDRDFGYNLRYDSQGKCYCSEETSKKISERLKKEWKDGKRKNHSKKLKENWNNNPNRKNQQSKILSSIKTKYTYKLYKDNIFLYDCNFAELTKLGLNNCLSTFNKKKSDDIIFKGYRIIRIKISDIVQSVEKSTGN